MKCVHCGEPWDNDCLHEEISWRIEHGGTMACRVIGTYPRSGNPRYDQHEYGELYEQIRQEFYKSGCKVFTAYGARCSNAKAPSILKERLDVLTSLLGEDHDGIDAMMEDAGEW